MAKNNKKKSAKRFSLFGGLNPFRWIGYDRMKEETATVRKIGQDVFKSFSNKGGEAPADFDACMQHYNLSEEDLQTLMKNAKIVCYVSLALAAALFFYTIYLVSAGFYAGAFVGIMMTLFGLVYAARQSFNRYCMQQRRLKVTWMEWIRSRRK